jgi:parvulin-like peptidyl-prolyl isomerase
MLSLVLSAIDVHAAEEKWPGAGEPSSGQGVVATARAKGSSSQLVDRIVAWIDNEPVALSEVEEALVQYQAEGDIPRAGTKENLLRKALDRWVNDQLMFKAAEKAGVKPAPETIDAQVLARLRSVEENEGGRENLDAVLKVGGVDREWFRERLRRLVTREWTIALAISTRVQVTDAEVAAFEEKRKAEGKPTVLCRVAQAFLPLNASVSDSQVEAALTDLTDMRLKAVKTGDFLATAHEWAGRHSAEGAEAGLLGTFAPGDMSFENLDKAMQALEVGHSSEPVRTPRGLHVLYLESKVSGRQLLFKERYESEQKKWVEQLRSASNVQVATPLLPDSESR